MIILLLKENLETDQRTSLNELKEQLEQNIADNKQQVEQELITNNRDNRFGRDRSKIQLS